MDTPDRVRKDYNRGHEVNEAHLAAGEDRPARGAELMGAGFALEFVLVRQKQCQAKYLALESPRVRPCPRYSALS